MSTPNISAAAPGDDTGFLAQPLPNRGGARFRRGFMRVWDVYSDLHARHTWPLAEVVSASQKDSKRSSWGNQHGEAHEVCGGIRSEISVLRGSSSTSPHLGLQCAHERRRGALLLCFASTSLCRALEVNYGNPPAYSP
jgi:hypothetical protein